MDFSLIAAADEEMGIGKENGLPWRLKGDLKYFSEVTTGSLELHVQPDLKQNAVIMGRKTWESLPEKSKPLKGRLNVVLTRGEINLPEGVLRAASFEEALKMMEARTDVGQVFVIGGANVFAQTIDHPNLQKIYLTRVFGKFECDTFFPKMGVEFTCTSEAAIHEEKGIRYKFLVYEKII